ncbi:MAG: hypothetical protein AAFZ92_11610 [Pseudomonadota bacterium]
MAVQAAIVSATEAHYFKRLWSVIKTMLEINLAACTPAMQHIKAIKEIAASQEFFGSTN